MYALFPLPNGRLYIGRGSGVSSALFCFNVSNNDDTSQHLKLKKIGPEPALFATNTASPKAPFEAPGVGAIFGPICSGSPFGSPFLKKCQLIAGLLEPQGEHREDLRMGLPFLSDSHTRIVLSHLYAAVSHKTALDDIPHVGLAK